jgi:hypothetical protein
VDQSSQGEVTFDGLVLTPHGYYTIDPPDPEPSAIEWQISEDSPQLFVSDGHLGIDVLNTDGSAGPECIRLIIRRHQAPTHVSIPDWAHLVGHVDLRTERQMSVRNPEGEWVATLVNEPGEYHLFIHAALHATDLKADDRQAPEWNWIDYWRVD